MNNLFSDPFPLITTDGELEEVFKAYPLYDGYYIASGSIAARKKRFESLWKIYEPYADVHFLNEIKKQFHQRSWEMYLGASLVKNGLVITSDDQGPDIKIVGDPPTFIEATAPTKGSGADRIPEIKYGGVQSIPEEEMLIRLAGALKDKYVKYQKYLDKGVLTSDCPFVIAVNKGQFGYMDPQIPLILKCLFGLGHYTLPMPISGKKGTPFWSRRESLPKKSGLLVPMTFFEENIHAGISAVIYDKEDVLNHSEVLGADCIVVHNPLARNKISTRVFSFFEQYEVRSGEIKKISN